MKIRHYWLLMTFCLIAALVFIGVTLGIWLQM